MKPIITLFILLISSALFAQGDSLPTAAKELATKLETWESQQRSDLEKEITEKRMQVVKALNGHMQKATKSGDLDGALAIRKYISSLNLASGGKSEPAVVAESKPQEMTKAEIPRDAHRYRKSYFKLFVEDGEITRTEAAKKCVEMGGQLISIESEKKWDEIKKNLLEDDRSTYIWIGAERRSSQSPLIWPNGTTMEFSEIRDIPVNRDRFKKDDYTFVIISPGPAWTYAREKVPKAKAYLCEWQK